MERPARAWVALAVGVAMVGLGMWALAGSAVESDDVNRDGTGEPLLGEAVGWSVFYGRSGTLWEVDLDTGVVVDHQVAGSPIAVSGPWLVLLEEPSRRIRAVPLHDPTAAAVSLSLDRTTGRDVAPTAEPGVVRLSEFRSGGSQWTRLIRIADGVTLDEMRSSEPVPSRQQQQTDDSLLDILRESEIAVTGAMSMASASPDGRLVALRGNAELVVYDTETEEVHTVPLGVDLDGIRTQFAPNSLDN